MAKVRDLVELAEKEIQADIEKVVIRKAKSMLLEIKATEMCLEKMQAQYNDFLEQEATVQLLLEQ